MTKRRRRSPSDALAARRIARMSRGASIGKASARARRKPQHSSGYASRAWRRIASTSGLGTWTGLIEDHGSPNVGQRRAKAATVMPGRIPGPKLVAERGTMPGLRQLDQMRAPHPPAAHRVLEVDPDFAEQRFGEILVEDVAEEERVRQRAVTEDAVRPDDAEVAVLGLLGGAAEPELVKRRNEVASFLLGRSAARDLFRDHGRHPSRGLREEGAHEPFALAREELINDGVEDQVILLREQILPLTGQYVALPRPTHAFTSERRDHEPLLLHPVEVAPRRALLDPQLRREVARGARRRRKLFENPSAGPFECSAVRRAHGVWCCPPSTSEVDSGFTHRAMLK